MITVTSRRPFSTVDKGWWAGPYSGPQIELYQISPPPDRGRSGYEIRSSRDNIFNTSPPRNFSGNTSTPGGNCRWGDFLRLLRHVSTKGGKLWVYLCELGSRFFFFAIYLTVCLFFLGTRDKHKSLLISQPYAQRCWANFKFQRFRTWMEVFQRQYRTW